MLDKVIESHIDDQDVIEDGVKSDIDSIIDKIDINAVIDNAEDALLAVAETVKSLIIEKYGEDAVKNGIDFGEKLMKMKRDIKIQISKDPHLNKEADDDNSPD